MALYAIGDLHLSLTANKPMDIFGDKWADHTQKLQSAFSRLDDDDVTVLCGDSSWGISLQEALADFRFIDALPGKKYVLKGNHDYWWTTAAKMRRFFTQNDITSIEILHNNCFFYGDHAICGTRGWFYEEDFAGTHDEKVLNREVGRLEASLQQANGHPILCFLHYPPIYYGYQCPEILEKLDRYGVKECYFGHLHGPTHKKAFEGRRNETQYHLVSSDYIDFEPKKILD